MGEIFEIGNLRTISATFVLIWLSGFRVEDLNVIFNQTMPNLHNQCKLAQRKTGNILTTHCNVADVKHWPHFDLK